MLGVARAVIGVLAVSVAAGASDAPSASGTTAASAAGVRAPGATTLAGADIASRLVGTVATELKLSCTFLTAPTNCGFRVQEKAPGRASIVNIGRDGETALRLHTRPGDSNVAGSGDMQRTDLWLTQAATGCYEGREQVWELSVLFPDDFAFPTWQRYALSGFHHTGRTGQGNFTLGFERGAGAPETAPGVLTFRGYGGEQDSGLFRAQVGPVVKNVWYDFVYHVRWSSGPSGFFHAWVNGEKKLEHRGPTLYRSQGCYFKLANYHTPICDPYPACIGRDPPSSVIYDRVIRRDVGAQ